jgi:hypothetical protein
MDGEGQQARAVRYGLNYLIDIENAVIVDVEPTPARTYDEVESTKTMLDRTERCFDLNPKGLAADTACGTGRFLGWLVGRHIMPHIRIRHASERDDGTFSRIDFRCDRRRGVYVCPNNKVLHTTGTVHEGTMLRYRASKFDCDICVLKVQCCRYCEQTGLSYWLRRSIIGTAVGASLLGLVPNGVLLPLLAAILIISAVKMWQHK